MTPEKMREIIDAVESELVYDPNRFDCARTVTLAVAMEVCARISSIARDEALEEVVRAMDGQRHGLEMAEIASAYNRNDGRPGAVAYNPEQTLWKKAATLVRALRTQPEEAIPPNPGMK